MWNLFKHEVTIKVFANKFNIHEKYTNTDEGNDICLIELPGTFAGGRAPCMMQPDSAYEIQKEDGTKILNAEKQLEKYHGAQCWVAGWGHTFYAGQSSNVARSVGLNLLSNDYCVKHRKCSISSLCNHSDIFT